MCDVLVGGVRAKAGSELVHARQTVVGVASANGVSAIDMVSTDFTGLWPLSLSLCLSHIVTLDICRSGGSEGAV